MTKRSEEVFVLGTTRHPLPEAKIWVHGWVDQKTDCFEAIYELRHDMTLWLRNEAGDALEQYKDRPISQETADTIVAVAQAGFWDRQRAEKAKAQ